MSFLGSCFSTAHAAPREVALPAVSSHWLLLGGGGAGGRGRRSPKNSDALHEQKRAFRRATGRPRGKRTEDTPPCSSRSPAAARRARMLARHRLVSIGTIRRPRLPVPTAAIGLRGVPHHQGSSRRAIRHSSHKRARWAARRQDRPARSAARHLLVARAPAIARPSHPTRREQPAVGARATARRATTTSTAAVST